MSTGWSGGSTRAWRALRAAVLARDRYRCKLACTGICTGTATHAHHTRGKSAGDDPAHIVAACAACNLHVGDPMRAPDPPVIPITRW